jgi:hypothetical protein
MHDRRTGHINTKRTVTVNILDTRNVLPTEKPRHARASIQFGMRVLLPSGESSLCYPIEHVDKDLWRLSANNLRWSNNKRGNAGDAKGVRFLLE